MSPPSLEFDPCVAGAPMRLAAREGAEQQPPVSAGLEVAQVAVLDVATGALEATRERVGAHLEVTSTRAGDVCFGGVRLVHPASALSAPPALDGLLATVRRAGASDLHLSPGNPPMVRLQGALRRLPVRALSASEVHTLVYDVMSNAQRRAYESGHEADFAVELPGVGRFRVNVLAERGGVGAVFRAVPTRVPTLAEVDAPEVLKKLASLPRGLVLVTGPSGSGKSATLAAMIDHRNRHAEGHILTIEDPIEYVHESRASLVRQREVGPHTQDYSRALRAALREDPNVIMVGELRDLETIRLALTAAETGHLVLATLHSSSAPKTIDRILDVFPTEEKHYIRTLLSEALAAVVSQALVPTKDGKSRVAAHEIMVCNAAVRNLIREGKVAQIASLLPTQKEVGNQTLEQSLKKLVEDGVISAAEARRVEVGKDGAP